MPAQLLYYPSIHPREEWLLGMMLFVNRIHTIVPTSHQGLDWLSGSTIEILNEISENSLVQKDPFHEMSPLDFASEEEEVLRFIESFAENGLEYDDASSIANWSSLAEGKLHYRVEQDLEDKGLIYPDRAMSGRILVPQGIANFVMNRLASRQAEELGIPCVTDKPMDFACNALHGFRSSRATHSSVALLSWSVPVLVPSGLRQLTPYQYFSIRKGYRKIATDIDFLLREVARFHQIDNARTLEHLQSRTIDAQEQIRETIEECRKEIREFKKAKFVRICVSGLVSALHFFPLVGNVLAGVEPIIKEASAYLSPPKTPTQAVYSNIANELETRERIASATGQILKERDGV